MDVAHLAGGGKERAYTEDMPGSPLPWGRRGLRWPGSGAGPSAAFPRLPGRMAGSLGNARLRFPSHSRSERWGKAKLPPSKQLLRILSFETKNRAYK